MRGTLSGSPGLDRLFFSIWAALASIQFLSFIFVLTILPSPSLFFCVAVFGVLTFLLLLFLLVTQ